MENPDIRALQKIDLQDPRLPQVGQQGQQGQLVWIPPGYEMATEPPVPEKQSHLWDYIWLLWRGRYLITFIFLVCVGIAGVRMLRATPIYQATARLQIASQTPKIINLGEDGYAQDNSSNSEYVGTQMLVLRSRNLAKQVIEELNLFAPDPTKEPEKPGFVSTAIASVRSYVKSFMPAKEKVVGRAGAKASPADSKQQMDPMTSARISALLGGLAVSQIRDTEVINVSYMAADPVECARVANAVCEGYIRWNYQAKTNSYEYARKWIDQKLYEVKASLEKTEENLYTVGGGQDALALTQGAESFSTKLDDMKLQLVAADQQLHDCEFRVQSIRNGTFARDSLSSGSAGNERVDSLRAQLEGLEVEYDKAVQQLGPEMPQVKVLKAAKTRLESQIGAEQKRSSGLTLAKATFDYDQALSQRDFLKKSYEEQKAHMLEIQQRLIKFNILKREVEVNKELYNSLLQRSREVGVTSSLKAGNVSIVENAEVPMFPTLPNKRRTMALGGFLGLFLGVGLVFFREYMDTTVRGPNDVEIFGRMATLGLLPHIDVHRVKKGERIVPELLCEGQPRSAFSENVRHMRTSVQYSLAGHSPKTILVTSATPEEGKTTVSCNLAIALAQSGHKTILVDADMKKPSLHKFFDVGRDSGLSDILTGRVNGNLNLTALKTETENLYVLPSGERPPNPVDLLDSVVMRNLLKLLAEHFDHVILDTAPSLDLADTGVLVRHVDGVILVAKPGKTPRASLSRVRAKLVSIGGRVLGVVLNDRKARRSHKRYGYGYGYRNNAHYGAGGGYGYGGEEIKALKG